MHEAQEKCPVSVWGPHQSRETFNPMVVEDSCAGSVSSMRVGGGFTPLPAGIPGTNFLLITVSD